MKDFAWSKEKNDWLRANRGVSFEDIEFQMRTGYLLDVVLHPNQVKYPRQRVFVVELEGYVFSVPFVESGDTVFLKTIIPSRKMTKRYLRSDEK